VFFLSDSDTTVFDVNSDPFDAVVEFDPGYALSGAMGYRFRNDFRVEIECINSIPSDEAYHVLYTAKYLEEELDTDMNKRKSRIKIISDSMKHAGNEMCDHVNSHEQSVINQGGITALSKI